jgi:hypothetical protein
VVGPQLDTADNSNYWLFHSRGRVAHMNLNPIRPGIAPHVAATVLLLICATGVGAQTLTDPNPHPNPPHPDAGKSAAARHMKACPEFGAGFYRIDGTGACVKIGGFVEGGVSSGH